MGGVYRFEDLRVWQAARQQCDRVGALLIQPGFQRDQSPSNQMNDAALSVMFNITGGFLRRRVGDVAVSASRPGCQTSHLSAASARRATLRPTHFANVVHAASYGTL